MSNPKIISVYCIKENHCNPCFNHVKNVYSCNVNFKKSSRTNNKEFHYPITTPLWLESNMTCTLYFKI